MADVAAFGFDERTVGLRQELVDAPSLGPAPAVGTPGRRQEQMERYHGASVVHPYG